MPANKWRPLEAKKAGTNAVELGPNLRVAVTEAPWEHRRPPKQASHCPVQRTSEYMTCPYMLFRLQGRGGATC